MLGLLLPELDFVDWVVDVLQLLVVFWLHCDEVSHLLDPLEDDVLG